MEVKAKAGSSTGEQRRPAKRRRRALPTCAPAKAATTFGLQSPPSPPPPPPPRPPEEEPGGGGGGSQGKEGRGSSSHDAMGTTTAGCVRGPTPADDSGFRLLSFRLASLCLGRRHRSWAAGGAVRWAPLVDPSDLSDQLGASK